jgi:endoglucanase
MSRAAASISTAFVLALLVGTIPAEAASRKVVLGVSVEEHHRDPSTFDAFKSKVGGIAPKIWSLQSAWGSLGGASTCQPDKGTCFFPRAAADWVHAKGATPMIFWNPYESIDSCKYARHQDIADGKYDSYIRTWARQADAYGHTVIVRYALEINGAYFPWGIANPRCNNTVKAFKDGWRHIVTIFRQEGATNVKWLWTVSRRTCRPAGCNPYKAYYPGKKWVNYVGFSVFNWGTANGRTWAYMPTLVGSVMKYFGQFTRKPAIIAENATNKVGGDKPAWIRSGYPKVYRRYPTIKAIVYLHVDLSYLGHPDWSLNTPNPDAYQAYYDVAKQRRFRGSF